MLKVAVCLHFRTKFDNCLFTFLLGADVPVCDFYEAFDAKGREMSLPTG